MDCEMTSETNGAEGDAGHGYFKSYEDLEVHRLMLQDHPRTQAYKTFIERNQNAIKDKIVVDVGAGTGILSLFAAKAGAKKVYAIEGSNMSTACQEIVDCNDLSDVITVIHGKVEDVNLPDNIKADVLVSEWMGFYLLHESMLNSVIVARDKWLKEDGIMLPSGADMYICPVYMADYCKQHFEYWSDVYGFDFSPLLPSVYEQAYSKPAITTVKPESILATPEQITHLELKYVAAEDVSKIIGSFNFEMTKNGILHGFACWFDVEFEGETETENDNENTVTLSTSPSSPETHWKQTVIFRPDPLLVSKGETVACQLQMTQDSENMRKYDICISVPEMESDEEGMTAQEVLMNALEEKYATS